MNLGMIDIFPCKSADTLSRFLSFISPKMKEIKKITFLRFAASCLDFSPRYIHKNTPAHLLGRTINADIHAKQTLQCDEKISEVCPVV
jgi:hypothetical protein